MVQDIKKTMRYLKRHRKDDNRTYFAGISSALFLALILSVFGISLVSYFTIRSGSLANVISSVLVDLTNNDRHEQNLGGLTVNPVLEEAARLKAKDMVDRGYFAHVSPDGKDSWYWFKQVGYVFSDAGENLAVDFSDSTEVENAWMNSPSHRANILNGRYTEVGIAVVDGMYRGKPTTFVVQMFGTPGAQKTVQQPIAEQTVPQEPTAPAVASISQPAAQSVVLGESARVAVKEITHQPKEVQETPILAPFVPIQQAAWYERLLVSPKTFLSYLYVAFSFIILGSLFLTLRLELKQHHRRHAIAAAFLIVLMAGILYVANALLFVPPTLAATAL